MHTYTILASVLHDRREPRGETGKVELSPRGKRHLRFRHPRFSNRYSSSVLRRGLLRLNSSRHWTR